MSIHDVTAALIAEGGIARIDRLAARTGRSHRAIRTMARRNRWWFPYSTVVGLPGIELASPGAKGRASPAWARSAVLHAQGRTGTAERDLAALTRRTALHHLGVARSAPSRIEVVIPASRYLVPPPRLAVVRSTYVRRSELLTVDGVEVVGGPALVRDLAAVRDVDTLRADAISLRHAGYLDVGDLRRVYERCVSFRGRGSVRRVLEDLEAAGRVDSVLEHDFREAFSREGIGFDRGQVAVPVGSALVLPGADGGAGAGSLHLDLGIAAIRFGIEVDSMAHHSSPEDLRRDAERRNRIAEVADDWRILHVTHADLVGARWERLVVRVRAVVSAQSRRYLGVPWPRDTDLRG